jgi:hypothetical protein
MRRLPHAVTLLFLLALAAAPAAQAAAPANDARADAQPITLPANVRGTTVAATSESDEPSSFCGQQIKSSVWYSFTARSDRSVLAALDANGELDATVEVFERVRSQLTPVDCATTNRRGQATVDVDAVAGSSYLIRVAALANSVADSFSLRVVVPDEPAQPPGQALPRGGAKGAVDRFANPDDAWAVKLHEGVAYRINFVTTSEGCAQLALHPPGTGDFDESPVRSARCDRHIVFTPPDSGRYSLLVQAPRKSRSRLAYRLRVGRTGPDDTAPGITLANDRRVRGTLRGSELDALDLYRFALDRRSDVRFRLRTGADFDLLLLDEHGRHRGSASTELNRRLRPGRYFVAVRARDGADGSYVLSRLARTITHARTLVNSAGSAIVAPGSSVTLGLRVTPAVSGRTTLVVERFDPLAGWLFDARLHPRVVNGLASVAFRPSSVGRWRVTGEFQGSRTASSSRGGTATFRVRDAEPPG